MASKVVKNDDQTVTLEVVVDGDEWKKAKDNEFQKLRKSLNINGFRKGHVPAAMAKKLIDKQALNYNTAYDMANKALLVGLNETEVKFVESPTLDIKKADDDEAVFAFTAEVWPEAELGEYKGFGLKKDEVAVTDEEVDAAINDQAKRKADFEAVEDGTGAEDGNLVKVDQAITLDGDEEPFHKEEDTEITLGTTPLNKAVYDALKGAKVGDVLDVDYKLEDDEDSKPFHAHITVKSIEKEVIPAIDDEFVASLKFEGVNTVEELKKFVRERIEASKDEEANDKFSEAVLDKAVENAKIEIPSVLIDREIDNMYKQLASQIQSSGLDVEKYLSLINSSPEGVKERMRPEAEKRLKNTFVLDAVAKAENLQVSNDEVLNEIKLLAQQYGIDEKKIAQLVRSEDIKEDLLREAAMNFLCDNQ